MQTESDLEKVFSVFHSLHSCQCGKNPFRIPLRRQLLDASPTSRTLIYHSAHFYCLRDVLPHRRKFLRAFLPTLRLFWKIRDLFPLLWCEFRSLSASLSPH